MKTRLLIAAGAAIASSLSLIAATTTTSHAETSSSLINYTFSSKDSPELTTLNDQSALSLRTTVGRSDKSSVRLMSKFEGHRTVGFSFELPAQPAGTMVELTCFAKSQTGSDNHIHVRLNEKVDGKFISYKDAFSKALTGQWASTTSSLVTKQDDSNLSVTIYSNYLHSTDDGTWGKIYVDDCALTTATDSSDDESSEAPSTAVLATTARTTT